MLLFLLSGWASGQGLDGVWRSRGYGIVYRIQGPALQEFQITEQTCVRGLTGRRVGDRVFAAKGQGKLSLRIDGDAAFLHLEEAVSDIQFDREARIPAVCDVPTADTPMGNFEVFTRTWAEHYISFEPRHVDWDKVVAEARAKIGVGTTPGQLFDALEGMIAPLRDGHTFIGAPKLRRGTKAYWRRGSDRLMLGWPAGQFAGPGRQALFQLTDRGYLQRQARKFCRGQLQFGHVDDATGYLRILGFGGYARHDDL